MRAPLSHRVAARGIGRPTPLCGGTAVRAAAHMHSCGRHAIARGARPCRSYKWWVVLDGECRCRRLRRRLQCPLRVPAATSPSAASLRPRLSHPAAHAGDGVAPACDNLGSS